MKIIVLLAWFGDWPWYYPYFLHSCSFNNTIDFLIITNNKKTNHHIKPKNLHYIYLSKSDFSGILSNCLGFNVNIEYSYKLCDFKPSYGLVFKELFKNYDFWGVCDLDLIFGNLRGFFTNDFLNRYDFVSMRHDYTTGCFSLYKNTEKMRSLFMQSKDYKLVLTSPEHFCFDECNFCWDELTSGKSIFEIQTRIESFTHVVKAAQSIGEIKAHFDFILMEGNPGKIIFDNGKIIYKQEFEAIMYHLFWLKKYYTPRKIPLNIPDKYFISPTRIYYKRTT